MLIRETYQEEVVYPHRYVRVILTFGDDYVDYMIQHRDNCPGCFFNQEAPEVAMLYEEEFNGVYWN